MSEALNELLPKLTKEQRLERIAGVRAANSVFDHLSFAARQELTRKQDWNQLSKSKASVVSAIVSAFKSVAPESNKLMNKAIRSVRQEVYAIEEWPTTERIVVSRVTSALRRLKLRDTH